MTRRAASGKQAYKHCLCSHVVYSKAWIGALHLAMHTSEDGSEIIREISPKMTLTSQLGYAFPPKTYINSVKLVKMGVEWIR